jgi:5'-nucleotidase
MRILLTNDDGIHAVGLRALQRQLRRGHSVSVVAPDRERSAIGHAITLHQPLRAVPVELEAGLRGWAVDGTPADCVKLALNEILDAPPDMVISGINAGANVGINLNYSGTVAAAKEAALQGLPAMAVSAGGGGEARFEEAARFTARFAPRIALRGIPPGSFLNVNYPAQPMTRTAGVRVSRQALGGLRDRFERRVDPRNRVYFWPGADQLPGAAGEPDSDHAALSAAFVTITPIRCDMTDYDLLEELQRWLPERL